MRDGEDRILQVPTYLPTYLFIEISVSVCLLGSPKDDVGVSRDLNNHR